MTAEDALSSDASRGVSHRAAPPLVVRAQGSGRTLQAGPAYWIGRDPEADIVVDEPLVSWRHAVLRIADGQWLLQDTSSTNGTFAAGERVRRVEITDSCQVRLGHPEAGPVVSCSITEMPDRGASAQPSATAVWSVQGTAVRDRFPSAVMPLPARVLRIGRAADNGVVVADLGVSRHHAELRRSPGGEYEVADLASHNGTFLNGQRVTSAVVAEGDVIGIGPAALRLVGDELQEFVDGGDVSLDARGLTVTLPNGKVLLDDVSFPLGERCLLGVIGPSGAGKSTLLGALTGMRPATAGSVFYDGRDLYANYAELRHRIGLVPQENILHTQLSAHRALGYAAELRFPRDTSAAERASRIGEVLGELSLTAHAGTRTASLSGGQQKRVNVALELLTKPSLLFLDEPTSGLDPGLDMSVMEMMSGLARDGRTVIVVTHSVANLSVCDRLLVLVPGGKVAYFGSPADGLRHFGQPGWAQVFRAFEAEPDRDWAGEYRRSAFFARYMTAPSVAGHPSAAVRAVPPPPKAQNRLAQLSTLVRRYLAVIASDRNYVGVLALLPVILGALVRAIPDPGGLTGTSNGNAIQVLLILVMGACLTGVANAVRELVKERPIYHRERAAGLSPGAYLASKFIVLGLISAVQAVVLVLIGLAGRPLPQHGAVLTGAPLVELMLGIAVLAVASMTAGLLISAVVSSSDKTMPLLVVTVLAEVVLSGGVFRLNGMAGRGQLSWLSPSRWGFGAAASTVNLNHVTPPPPGNTPDPLWQHSPHIWLLNMAMQLVLAAVLSGLTWWRLRQASPGRRR
jgi:ABC-type multidrug transport system ATPase subunit/pSer/pThr/pTyr-binding forkhead associated (FHA) protein